MLAMYNWQKPNYYKSKLFLYLISKCAHIKNFDRKSDFFIVKILAPNYPLHYFKSFGWVTTLNAHLKCSQKYKNVLKHILMSVLVKEGGYVQLKLSQSYWIVYYLNIFICF